MRRTLLFCMAACLALACPVARGQSANTLRRTPWEHNPILNFYILGDDFYTVPVYRVNTGWLHLEARYNYEDRNTFSAWFGFR